MSARHPQRAYSNETVVTHRDPHGAAVSSASAPGVVVAMLEQLDVRPGQRVLEIGSGTGYNAALLARLVGAAGVPNSPGRCPSVRTRSSSVDVAGL